MTAYRNLTITAQVHPASPNSRRGSYIVTVKNHTTNQILLQEASYSLHLQSESTIENNFIASNQARLDMM